MRFVGAKNTQRGVQTKDRTPPVQLGGLPPRIALQLGTTSRTVQTLLTVERPFSREPPGAQRHLAPADRVLEAETDERCGLDRRPVWCGCGEVVWMIFHKKNITWSVKQISNKTLNFDLKRHAKTLDITRFDIQRPRHQVEKNPPFAQLARSADARRHRIFWRLRDCLRRP